MAVNVTLVDPEGEEWVAGSAVEVNDLLARGYRLKGQGGRQQKPANPPSAVANPAPVTNTGTVAPAGDGSTAK